MHLARQVLVRIDSIMNTIHERNCFFTPKRVLSSFVLESTLEPLFSILLENDQGWAQCLSRCAIMFVLLGSCQDQFK